MPNLIEEFRRQAVTRLFTNTVNNCWPTWRDEIQRQLGENLDVNQVLNLGDHLGEIFRQTGTAGREQSQLSGGGTGWESLVGWYMNFCLLGSRTVVVKYTKTLIPQAITNATAVMYGTFASNSESDLVAIVFPDTPTFTDDLENEILTNTTLFKEYLDRETDNALDQIDVGIIQCKTNWNDNSQVPMLWDMVYRAQQFRDQNISVGRQGYGINDLHDFSYSFVTVPTSRGPFRPNSTQVNRVRNLSGGNYWGRPTETNVANSIQEIFQRNFSNGQNNGLRVDLRDQLQNLRTEYDYFRLHNSD